MNMLKHLKGRRVSFMRCIVSTVKVPDRLLSVDYKVQVLKVLSENMCSLIKLGKLPEPVPMFKSRVHAMLKLVSVRRRIPSAFLFNQVLNLRDWSETKDLVGYDKDNDTTMRALTSPNPERFLYETAHEETMHEETLPELLDSLFGI